MCWLAVLLSSVISVKRNFRRISIKMSPSRQLKAQRTKRNAVNNADLAWHVQNGY